MSIASKPGKQALGAAPSSVGSSSASLNKLGYGARGAAAGTGPGAVSAGKKRGASVGGGAKVAGKQVQ